ncbi:autophagy protein 13 [Zalaria obscura]|uniref:Autophagy protein 13 n=1 Tax=Zalaria obscura TaxID=2024903 RepID=A0ACC3SLE9_9PEZI
MFADKLVQHFFSKAALMILSSRVTLSPAYNKDGDPRFDKWFNTWIEDTNVSNSELQEWKTMDVLQQRPSPLVIEFFMDMTQFTQNQALVIVDEEGQRCVVGEALERLGASSAVSPTQTPTEVVYERWTISLDDPSNVPASQLTEPNPNVYKKGVVMLRSLYTYLRLLPAWKLGRRMTRQAGSNQVIKPQYRILKDSSAFSPPDTLTCSLTSDTRPSTPVTETFRFEPLTCPFGALSLHVVYRANTEFRVEPSEAILSSRFDATYQGAYRQDLGTQLLHQDDRATREGHRQDIQEIQHGMDGDGLLPGRDQNLGSLRTGRFGSSGLVRGGGGGVPSTTVGLQRSLQHGHGGMGEKAPEASTSAATSGTVNSVRLPPDHRVATGEELAA